MRDDAVSPVVAFMLLLMVVVSFISVLNAYYIPSLKEQAEVQHLHEVEESFSKITPNMLQILTFRKNLSMKETVPLGGGDVIFSSLKSSGYLEVKVGDPISLINVSVGNNPPMPNLTSAINESKIQYKPVGNFWINQGYVWEDGLLNVTKGLRTTTLQFSDENTALTMNEKNNYYTQLRPQISYSEHQNNISTMQIDLVNIQNVSSYRYINGNGIGNIQLKMEESNRTTVVLNNSNPINLDFDYLKDPALFEDTSFDNTIDGINKSTNVNSKWTDNTRAKLNFEFNNSFIVDEYTQYPNVTIVRWNLSEYVL